ncbi:hypothetical protein GGX14DRAFT_400042 [Mycena pura]|uniref:Uncharacterized protein n=1 Tax=Mycena pura TaxID=153505 RepID=A0AAD6V6Q8_9AGAR|nr:hypothetical protein GGX14DRAFT_400042 [Mycena pura]
MIRGHDSRGRPGSMVLQDAGGRSQRHSIAETEAAGTLLSEACGAGRASGNTVPPASGNTVLPEAGETEAGGTVLSEAGGTGRASSNTGNTVFVARGWRHRAVLPEALPVPPASGTTVLPEAGEVARGWRDGGRRHGVVKGGWHWQGLR